MKLTRRIAIAAVAGVAAVGIAAGTAVAATTSSAPPPVRIACDQGGTRALVNAYENVPANFTCPAGDFAVSLSGTGTAGAAGATGPAGPKGATGATGPSGVQAVATVTGSATLPAIGGSWSAGHADVKDISLPAGTYLVTVTGDFYRTAASTATPVLQIQLNGGDRQLTGYTGAFPYDPAEAVGAVDGVPNGLEQTAVAEGIITLTTASTLSVDAFGYNPNRSGDGGGDFGVNATVSYVQLTPAS